VAAVSRLPTRLPAGGNPPPPGMTHTPGAPGGLPLGLFRPGLSDSATDPFPRVHQHLAGGGMYPPPRSPLLALLAGGGTRRDRDPFGGVRSGHGEDQQGGPSGGATRSSRYGLGLDTVRQPAWSGGLPGLDEGGRFGGLRSRGRSRTRNWAALTGPPNRLGAGGPWRQGVPGGVVERASWTVGPRPSPRPPLLPPRPGPFPLPPGIYAARDSGSPEQGAAGCDLPLFRGRRWEPAFSGWSIGRRALLSDGPPFGSSPSPRRAGIGTWCSGPR
jgi:hypothetical protein